MERTRLHGGQLRSAGYDQARRVLQVELASGELIEYSGVGREIARRLIESAAPWSYYRDNIVDEFTARSAGRVRAPGADENPFG